MDFPEYGWYQNERGDYVRRKLRPASKAQLITAVLTNTVWIGHAPHDWWNIYNMHGVIPSPPYQEPCFARCGHLMCKTTRDLQICTHKRHLWGDLCEQCVETAKTLGLLVFNSNTTWHVKWKSKTSFNKLRKHQHSKGER